MELKVETLELSDQTVKAQVDDEVEENESEPSMTPESGASESRRGGKQELGGSEKSQKLKLEQCGFGA